MARRPRLPWREVVVGGLVVLAVVVAAQVLIGIVFGLLKAAVVAAIVLGLLYLVVIGPPDRR